MSAPGLFERHVALLEERRERLGHLSGCLKASGRLLGHHLGDQGGELGRHLGAEQVQRIRVPGDMGLVEVVERFWPGTGGWPVRR